MAMLATQLMLKKRYNHVIKYREGVATPQRLIDHLAGANLAANADVDFYTTVPRYIHTNHETRLSRLFFHHVLYPAGGARLPYQAVIVRHGRGVKVSGANNTATQSQQQQQDINTTAAQPNPLLAPQLPSHVAHPSTASGRVKAVVPARQPQFIASRPTPPHASGDGEYAMNHPSIAIWHRPSAVGPRAPSSSSSSSSSPSTSTSKEKRVVCDEVFMALTQHISAAFERAEGGDALNFIAQHLRPNGGWLPTTADSSSSSSSLSPATTEEKLQQKLRDGLHQHLRQRTSSSSIYALTSMPKAAMLSGPRTNAVCGLVGGVEPAVSFAVGRPRHDSAQPYTHMSCLVKINAYVPHRNDGASTEGAASDVGKEMSKTTRRDTSSSPATPTSSSKSVEPWRLGMTIDPHVPLRARTVADGVGTSSHNTTHILGMEDAETYFLPQRELLMELYVPQHTTALCREHNAERCRRQMKMGRASFTKEKSNNNATAMMMDDDGVESCIAWPAARRQTPAVRMQGKWFNAQAAMGEVASQAATVNVANTNTNTNKTDARQRYEVRVLPGDVVFIPRGYGFTVRRVVGTAYLRTTTTSSSSSNNNNNNNGSRTTPKPWSCHVCPSTSLDVFSGTQHANTLSCKAHPSGTSTAATDDDAMRITAVDVDGLCLHYEPYPHLTNAQAQVYLSANYVHRGIDEFYEQGGNAVHHRYE